MIHERWGALRLGWPAALFDLFTAAAALVIAYSLRFDDTEARSFLVVASRGLAVLVAAHFLAITGIGLYRALRLWPVRLTAGTIAGVLLGLGLTAISTSLEGVSRQAMVVYAVLFVIGGMAWRAAVALQASVCSSASRSRRSPGSKSAARSINRSASKSRSSSSG